MQLNPLALALSTAGGSRFNPTRLFLDASQGFWLDASDRSVLFQDSAGTTPVTALGDPIGLWLDKSGRGNHFVQTTSGARPVWGSWPLSAAIAGRVRNLVTSSEDVTAAVWGRTRVTTPSADTIVETTVLGSHSLFQLRDIVSGQQYTQQVTLKKGALASAPDVMQLTFGTNAFGASQFANVNVVTGAVISVTGATCTSVSDQDVSGGWKFTYTATASATTNDAFFLVAFCNNNSAATRLPSYAGSTTADCKVYRTQSEQSATATAYQRVGVSSRYDVSEAGQPQVYFVSPNGVNDFMVSAANVDFSATDRMFVCAGGVVKTEVATLAQFMIEHTENAGSTNGAFEFSPMPSNSAIKLGNGRYRSRGTDIATATDPTSTAAPRVFVYSGLSVISTDTCVLRQNGVQVATSATDQGSGNYASALTYLFSRAGTSLFYSGNTYQIVAVGKTPTTSELNQTETFVAAKTKGSLA